MIIFNYLIFPGILFSAVVGLMAGWLDRKISARLQWRVGPPWHQNFTDIIKLLHKEAIIPQAAGVMFLAAPFIGLMGLALADMLLGNSIISPLKSFNGDLILILYLLTMPALALMLGASASANPLASVGASREMKLAMAYELPFILSAIVVIIKCGSIEIGSILSHQVIFGSNAASLSGCLAFIAALFCAQAKLGLAPFEISEAEQEIMAGVLIEYSGWALAVFKLVKAMLIYTMPVFLVVLFFGKDTTPLLMIAKFVAIFTAFILIKNTNPRLRIDQAMRFFWGPMTIMASIAVVLALLGK
ncbi:MAG: NADH-quinone oxidoreductase subunit H [Candidatus Omnitrophota bacterium]|nr:NADH-quinone oxidoreductase subunit H [Candidatus Omnitrophota bacterium]